jgi:hypothetical protein
MLRTTNPQPSLWEAILPDACLGLPAELARVDTSLTPRRSWPRSSATSTCASAAPVSRWTPTCG